MEVYFNSNFWDKRQGKKHPGTRTWIDKYFTWAGKSWRIPAVYSCKEGLVADFICSVSRENMREYLNYYQEKYNPGDREEFTQEELEQIERRNPFSMNYKIEAYVNGRKLEHNNMCGMVWNPPKLFREVNEPREAFEEIDSSEQEELMEAYQCSREDSHYFVRGYFSWKKEEPIRELTFQFLPSRVPNGGEHFHVTMQDGIKDYTVNHPVTGQTYTITGYGMQQEVLSFPGHRLELEKNLNYPNCFAVFSYCVKPDLGQEEFQIMDCSSGDSPIERAAAGKSSSSISVIGGSEGPTSIFLVGKGKTEGKRSVCSALHFQPVEELELRPVFYMLEEKPLTVPVFGSSVDL